MDRVRATGLFFDSYYRARYEDVAESGIDPLLHFVRYGAAEMRSPNPLFDPGYYQRRYSDVPRDPLEALFHFAERGGANGRRPHPLFDTPFYVRHAPEARDDPLAHYLRSGRDTLIDPNPEFDSRGYLANYPEASTSEFPPLAHHAMAHEWDRVDGSMAEARRWAKPAMRSSLRLGRVARAPDAPRPDTCVILHLYFVDLWDEIRAGLENIAEFDLFVSISDDAAIGTEDTIREAFPDAIVRRFPNRGRDFGPFVEWLREIDPADYELLCKIHTKKSTHTSSGHRWRAQILGDLIGSKEVIHEIRELFDRDERLGLVGPEQQLHTDHLYWGQTQGMVEDLARRMGIASDDVRLEFFAGSMFWARPEALKPIRDLGLTIDDFPIEGGQRDGTRQHALERAVGLAVERAGFTVEAFTPRGRAARSGIATGSRQVRVIALYEPLTAADWTATALPKDEPLSGAYDTRVAAARARHAVEALRSGIHGFCYPYFGHGAHRAEDAHLNDLLSSSEPDMPMCLRWEGHAEVADSELADLARRSAEAAVPFLMDERYVRHNGFPLLVIRRPTERPWRDALAAWRTVVRARGLRGLAIAAVDPIGDWNPIQQGFDDIVSSTRAESDATGFGSAQAARVREASLGPSTDDALIIIDSWNDWKSGAVIEPTRDRGDAFVKTVIAAQATLQVQSALRDVPAGEAASEGLAEFREIVIVPFAEMLDSPSGGVDHLGGPIWPDFPAQTFVRHHRMGRRVDDEPRRPNSVMNRLDEPIAWAGPAIEHFGHQVGEYASRIPPTLMAWPDASFAFAPHLRRGTVTVTDSPAYFREMLKWYGVPLERVTIINEPVVAARLLVAAQSEQLYGPGPGPAVLDWLDTNAERNLGRVQQHGMTYVSRAAVPLHFAGEEYLEQALAEAGVRVIRPETLPLIDQLRAYASAATLVMPEGSAIHGTQLLGRGLGDVAVLARFPPPNIHEPLLRARARSLTFQEGAQLIHGTMASGVYDYPHGLPLLDERTALEVFESLGVKLRRSWDSARFQKARDADVAEWLADQQTSGDIDNPGARATISATSAAAGIALPEFGAFTLTR